MFFSFQKQILEVKRRTNYYDYVMEIGEENVANSSWTWGSGVPPASPHRYRKHQQIDGQRI